MSKTIRTTSPSPHQQNHHYDSIFHHLNSLIQKSHENKRRIFVGIAGAPASGKSTFTNHLMEELAGKLGVSNQIQCLPMDGFHLYKRELSTEMKPRRGAHFTFNAELLYRKLKSIKEWQSEGKFPSFEHGVGDPKENDIQIRKDHCIIIMEGLYMCLTGREEALKRQQSSNKPLTGNPTEPMADEFWGRIQNEILDETWFIDVPLEVALERLQRRHMQTWNMSEEEALQKIEKSDGLNARLVMETKPNATYILIPGDKKGEWDLVAQKGDKS